MATINYAIVLTEEARTGEEQLVVRHLYHHLADAKGCAAATSIATRPSPPSTPPSRS